MTLVVLLLAEGEGDVRNHVTTEETRVHLQQQIQHSPA